ncbi:MAG: GNAT family N-acetyltransferase [Thermoplasmata archaeon]|nr:GNAT family N-acetyltransferase [Thermoplasmata archaeon]
MSFDRPVRLVGKHIELTPLAASHAPALADAARDPEIWRYWRSPAPVGVAEMEATIRQLLALQASGTDLCFTVLNRVDQGPVGMTRFLEIERPSRRAEVGGTWFAREWWRSPFNTESKRLMLGYAFDSQCWHRVQLKTDLRNDRSQRAIERLGAVREGVLREHIQTHSGYMRSSVYYSILQDEWPAVRQRLDRLLERPWAGAPRALG